MENDYPAIDSLASTISPQENQYPTSKEISLGWIIVWVSVVMSIMVALFWGALSSVELRPLEIVYHRTEILRSEYILKNPRLYLAEIPPKSSEDVEAPPALRCEMTEFKENHFVCLEPLGVFGTLSNEGQLYYIWVVDRARMDADRNAIVAHDIFIDDHKVETFELSGVDHGVFWLE